MKAAFGKAIITPPNIADGISMAGFYRKEKAYAVLDHVYARGVLIEDLFNTNIPKRLLLISLDLTKAPLSILNYFKDQIQKKVDISLGKGQILIACTHTHHAPDITGEYYWPGQLPQVIKGILFGHNRYDKYIVWMAKRIVLMVQDMVKQLQPATIAWENQNILDPIWLNRRHPTDRRPQTMGVLAFKSESNGQLIGIVVKYGIHPTSMSFKNNKVSADYCGQVCSRIEQQTGNTVSAVYFTGSCGDINPLTTAGTDFEAMEKEKVSLVENNEKHPNHYLQLGTFEHAQKIGYFLGEQALNIAKNIPDSNYYSQFQFKAYTRLFWVPIKDKQHEKTVGVYSWKNWMTNKLIAFLKRYIITPIAIHAAKEPNFPGLSIKGSVLKGYNCYTMLHYIECSVKDSNNMEKGREKNEQKTANFGIMGIPGELFFELKEKLLAKSPLGKDNTFDFHMANDWLGYLFPLREYITHSDYEPFASTTPIGGEYFEKEYNRFWKEIEMGIVPFS